MSKNKKVKKLNVNKHIIDDKVQKKKAKSFKLSDDEAEEVIKEDIDEKDNEKAKSSKALKEEKEVEDNKNDNEKSDTQEASVDDKSIKGRFLNKVKWTKNLFKKLFNFTAEKSMLEFWIGLLILLFGCFLITSLTSSDLTVSGIVVGIFVVGFASLTAGRFKDVGLKWYVPVLGIAFIIIAFIGASIGGSFITSSYSLEYLSILTLFSTTGAISIEEFIPAIILLVGGFIFILLDLLFILVISCKKQDSFKKTKHSKTQILFIINFILAGLLIAIGTISLSKVAENKYNDVENLLRTQMYGTDDNGNEKSGITVIGVLNQELSEYDINTIIDQFNTSNAQLKEANVDSACQELNNNMKVYGVWGQQVKKNGQSANLMEIIFYNPTNQDQQVTLVSGIYNDSLTENYNITITVPAENYYSIPFETAASFTDGMSVTLQVNSDNNIYQINTRLYSVSVSTTSSSNTSNALVD